MKDKGYKHVSYPGGWIWVEGGQYSEEELQKLLDCFKKRREALTFALPVSKS